MEPLERIPLRRTALEEQVAPRHTALVVVDMQNDFCADKGKFVADFGKSNRLIKGIIPHVRRLVDTARACGVLVVHLRVINDLLRNPISWHHFWGEPTVALEGSWGAEFIEELTPAADEPVVTKYTYDGFVDTDLNSILQKCRVETIVFAGVDSDVCVRDTAAHGFALGYTPVFAADCLAGDNEIGHEGALQSMEEHYGKVVSSGEIIDIWAST